MKSLIALVSLAAIGLSACDVSHPVAVVGPSDTVYRGTATATLLEGGWFQVSNGGNTCSGQYNPAAENRMVTFPVRCTNGLTGVGKASYDNARSGGGEIVMRDGTRWRFIFGKQALRV